VCRDTRGGTRARREVRADLALAERVHAIVRVGHADVLDLALGPATRVRGIRKAGAALSVVTAESRPAQSVANCCEHCDALSIKDKQTGSMCCGKRAMQGQVPQHSLERDCVGPGL
jgi:hypothetical protein